jgi:alpha-galactosidase/6-phospho-beta-glucosidase family protein
MIHYAVQADPLTAAVCTLPQVRSMVDELFDENGEYVKDWPNSRAL